MTVSVIYVDHADAAQLDIDALVLEEDTDLILCAPVVLRLSDEHPVRLMTSLYETQAQLPGTIVIKPGAPLRILAIVHDLALEVSTCAQWIAAALHSALEYCVGAGLSRVAVETLGANHGRFSSAEFCALVDAELALQPSSVDLTLDVLAPQS